ncbi:ankyrin repeat-containing domain protein [Triangularia setosa]|uniref:Ankyrin repeat-containing domain protein n=1 Tax=Triangularia setosa TaxID=2587417 RepID=A0AAN6VYB4_9PEZI|nr:ankyrin repeat-containing domain protein [Podospora setosa]
MSNTKERHQGLQVVAPAPDEGGRPGGEITIDIVAVPGLGANPAKSFGSEKNPAFNWLSDRMDGIRAEIPTARVLLHYYDSEWYGNHAQEQDLHNASSKLLEYLVVARKDNNTRPLVFLGHSMGGLVVARALTIAHQAYHNLDYMRLVECFAGAIFFGTPFKGSSAQANALMLAHLFEKLDKAVPSQMLEILKPGNDALVDVRRDFTNIILKEPKAKVTCFYEEVKTNYAREAVPPQLKAFFSKKSGEIVVTKDSASLDVANVLSLHRDHRQLNRFDNAKDNEYLMVRNQLKEIAKSAQFIVNTRLRASKQSIVDDQVFYRLAINLNVGDVAVKLKSVQSSSGDSSWILSEEQYQQWSAPLHSFEPSPNPVLWVSGGEGLGKSKAAAATIGALEKLEARNHEPGARNTMVAYFFCDGTPDCRMAETMLRSLIWQLILKKRSLGQYVKSFAAPAQEGDNTRGNTQSGGGQFKFAKLWKGLTDILNDDGVQDVYFVINSMHYLSEGLESTRELLEQLSESIMGDDDRNPFRQKVRWAVFSRDSRPNIENALGPGVDGGYILQIDLNSTSMGSMRRELLRTFTRDAVQKVARYKQYSTALQYFVFSSLQKRAENNTLWVEVVCKLLQQLPADYSTVRKALEMLPPDPESLIEQAWNTVLDPEVYAGNAPLETVKEILRTLVVAYEDPTINELRVLAELKIELSPTNTNVTEEDIVLGYIRDCGPLLRTYDAIGDDGYGRWATRVTFIHPLARDTLLSPALSKRIGLTPDANDTEVKWQHGVIGLRCWDYMQEQLSTGGVDDYGFETFVQAQEPAQKEEFQDEIDKLFPEGDEDDVDVEKMDMSALDYPLKYWLRHGNKATSDFVDTLDIKHNFWSFESTARKRWWGSFAQRELRGELKDITALHVAAYFGLLPLVDSLLADGHENEIHCLDSWANQPLHWAAAKGNLDVCRRLLHVPGIEIDNGIQKGDWTPLHMAAWQGQLEVIQYLRDMGADINAICNDYGTPLTLALIHRQADAAALLLRLRADPTIVAGEHEQAKSPPLEVAAAQGNDELVSLLLEFYGESDWLDGQYGCALAAAASAGDLEIVQMLLTKDVDWQSREEALASSSAAGFGSVVEAILEVSPGIPCGNAFIAAAMYGHRQILERLWQHHGQYQVLSQQNVNNALYEATDTQQELVVKLLLEVCGAEATATGDAYGNALTASAYDGTMTILQMLLAHGAQIAAPEGYPLQVAALNGHVDIVQSLLQLGADPNAFHPVLRHGTALQAACVVGETQIVKLLLSRHADPNVGGGEFTNPLTAATSNGHGEIVRLLLEAGANPNQPGGFDGSYPLINAATSLPASFLELLIQAGAKVDAQDPDEDTALIISAFYGDTDCVTTLLRHGADVNLSGAHHGSPLHAAASRGFVETCRVLLDHGANPHTLAGPFYTVLQAAAASGDADCVKLTLDRGGPHLDINVQGGAYFTALHAAAEHDNDGGLRHLLSRAPSPHLNVFPPPRHPLAYKGAALHAAAFKGCNRNARLLVQAGADVSIVAGKHGTVLQAAALKCEPLLVEMLLDHGAKVDSVNGKYGSALVAAVARAADTEADWDDEEERVEVLGMLLDHVPATIANKKGADIPGRIPAKVYRSALETALMLGEKDDFKRILKKMQEAADEVRKSGNKGGFPNMRALLTGLRKAAEAKRQAVAAAGYEWDGDNNSDFGDDVVNEYQEFYGDDEFDDDEDTEVGADREKKEDGDVVGTRGVGGSGQGLPIRGGPGGEEQQQGEARSRGFGGGGDGEYGGGQPTSSYGGAQSRGFQGGGGGYGEQPASPTNTRDEGNSRGMGGYAAVGAGGAAVGGGAGYYASQNGGFGGGEDDEDDTSAPVQSRGGFGGGEDDGDEAPAQIQSRGGYGYQGADGHNEEEQTAQTRRKGGFGYQEAGEDEDCENDDGEGNGQDDDGPGEDHDQVQDDEPQDDEDVEGQYNYEGGEYED